MLSDLNNEAAKRILGHDCNVRTGGALAAGQSLAAGLKQWQSLPTETQISKLKEYRSSWTLFGAERQESAYVLARLLQKSLPPGPPASTSQAAVPSDSSNNAESNSPAKEAINLFQEASKHDPLWQRSQEHIVEIATAFNMEPELRRHLEMILARPVLSNRSDSLDKTEAAYALGQSYYRTNELDQAKSIFLKLKKEAQNSRLGTAANYYLGQIDIQESQPPGASASSNVITDQALKYFRLYLRESPDGRFAREITSRLLNAANAAAAAGSAPTSDATASNGGQTRVPVLPAADRDLFARVYYLSGDWSDAVKQWDLAGEDNKLVERSICLAHMGRLKEAKEALFKAIRKSDTSYGTAATLLSGPLTRAQTINFYKEILAIAGEKQEIPLWNIGYRLMVDQPEAAQPYSAKADQTLPYF